MPEEKIGTVVRYWPKAGAAQIELEHGILQVGDRLRIRGRDGDLEQEVESLEVEHRAKSEGFPGEHIAVQVDRPVRERDEVFLLRLPKLSLLRDD